MNQAPRSLIQIHYHNRLGGVRQVMRQYADTFRSCFNSAAPDYVFCRKSEPYPGPGRLIDIPEADYHAFRSVNGYRNGVKACKQRLLGAFNSIQLDYPVAVIAHNLNLGKNPALAEAFTWCAGELGADSDRFRFFLVMHDYAEQGRLPLLRSLKQLTDNGVGVFSRLYASCAPVHYVTLNETCRKRTGLSLEYCSLLPNLITTEETVGKSPDPGRLREYLRRHAKEYGCNFNIEKKLFCYPSRMIYRKNIMEALLLATVVWDGSLVLGQSGTTASDKQNMATVTDFAKRYDLSLVIDPAGINRAARRKEENPFRHVYRIADYTLSTSYAEGFGYGYHEPWLYDCPVVCRYPEGMSVMPGLTIDASYRRVPIPVSWVRTDKIYNWLTATYEKSIGKRYPSKRNFLKNFVTDGTVDFGRIGTPQQIRVIRHILNKDSARSEIMTRLLREQKGWPGSSYLLHVNNDNSIGKNRIILEAWGNHGFRREFVNVFSRVPRIAHPEKWYETAEKYFLHSGHFQPLAPR